MAMYVFPSISYQIFMQEKFIVFFFIGLLLLKFLWLITACLMNLQKEILGNSIPMYLNKCRSCSMTISHCIVELA